MIQKKMLCINGSPRKGGSTAQLLNACIQGAKAEGIKEAELVHLIDILDGRSCVSCYGCKNSSPKGSGLCVLQDGYAPIYQSINEDIMLVFGSPVYDNYITGLMKIFLERLIFPYHTAGFQRDMFFDRIIPAAFILTASAPEEKFKNKKYDEMLHTVTASIRRIYGSCEELACYDTYHFVDYAKVYMAEGVAERKTKNFLENFPKDRIRAYELGGRLVKAAMEKKSNPK